jgi:hypothetical protein
MSLPRGEPKGEDPRVASLGSRSLVLILAFLGSIASCTLLTGVGSLHETSCVVDCGSADVVETGEAKVKTESGSDSPTEGGTDVVTADRDAGPPVGQDWCASQDAGYRLCSDFDLDAEPVTQGFDLGAVPVPFGEGGSFELDPKNFVSPPRGALGIANPFPAGGTSGDRLEGTLWPLGPTPAAVACSVEWNPREVSTVSGDYAHVFSITAYSDAAEADQVVNLSIQMHADGSVIFLEDYPDESMDANHPLVSSVAIDKWHAVELALGTSGAGTTYKVTFGGVEKSAGTLVVPLPSTSHVIFSVGPAYFAGSTSTSSPGWTFDYDNVVCF